MTAPAPFSILMALLHVGLLCGFTAPAQADCTCGCQAGHCAAGVPAHLNCGRATPEQKQRVVQRREALGKSIDNAVANGSTDCNELVQAAVENFDAAAGRNLKGKTADQIIEFLFSEKRVEQSIKEGWSFAMKNEKGEVRALTVDDAINYANGGQLVMGILHSKLLNQLKAPQDNNGKPYTHGHVFLVTAGGKPGGNPDDTFRNLPVANAGNGMKAKKTTANWVLPNWIRQPSHKELVVFVVLEKK